MRANEWTMMRSSSSRMMHRSGSVLNRWRLELDDELSPSILVAARERLPALYREKRVG